MVVGYNFPIYVFVICRRPLKGPAQILRKKQESAHERDARVISQCNVYTFHFSGEHFSLTRQSPKFFLPAQKLKPTIDEALWVALVAKENSNYIQKPKSY